jgi:hypothetical protein
MTAITIDIAGLRGRRLPLPAPDSSDRLPSRTTHPSPPGGSGEAAIVG